MDGVNWSLYEKRLTLNGSNIRNREINQMKDNITNSFFDSPSCKKVFINGSDIGTYVQVNEGRYSHIKNILMMPDEEINTGDIFDFDNKKWLCVETSKTNPVYQSGNVFRCDYSITLNKNNVLHEIFLSIESGIRLYQMGLWDDRYTGTPASISIARCINNEITQLIKRGDVYKIGLQNWKVIDINDIIEEGILILKLEWCVETTESKEVETKAEIEIQNNNLNPDKPKTYF